MNKQMVVVGGLALVAIVAVVVIMSRLSGAPSQTTPTNPITQESASPLVQASTTAAEQIGAAMSEKTFSIEASNFKFSLPTMSVKKGDTVKITLTNTEGMHNFMLDEFNVKSKTIQAGKSDTVQFVADKSGSFEYYCSVSNHRAMGMKGTLVVE